MIVECVFCEVLYLTDWPCWTCRQFHCRKCTCKWKFLDDDMVFKPLFYAPKAFQAITRQVEEIEVVITQYEKGIKGFDFVLHRMLHPAISKQVVTGIGIPEMLFETLRTTTIERIPTTFDLLKMVANPTPMPFTTVWHSATEFARTLRLTAFLGLAQQEVIKRALADSLLFPSADAEKAARLLASMRSTMVKRGAKGRAKEVAPESIAKLWQHVDGFWTGKGMKIRATGTAAVVTGLLGYGYAQYKALTKLLDT